MKGGDHLELEATHVDLEGQGIARAEGREVRVHGLFGGERGLVRIEHVSKGGPVAHGRLIELRAGERVPVACAKHESRDGRCGGCPLMPLSGEAQRAQKKAALEALGLRVDAVLGDGRELGYRVSSKRVAFGGPGRLVLGSFARGSHTPADMHGCLVEHPALSAAASGIVRVAQALGVPAFDERKNEGLLRAVWLRLVALDRSEVAVTLVATEAPWPDLVRGIAELAGVRVVAWSKHEGVGNDLRGEAPTLLHGAPEDLGLLGFLQPNAPLAERMYESLLADENDTPLEGAHAFDLFAGSGATTSRLRARFARVDPCESYPESAAALGVAPEKAEDFLARTEHAPELVIANPPRKGLGDSVVTELLRLAPPRVQIMACGPKGLAKDLAALEAGGYRVVQLLAFDTLPQTPHAELVAKLVRA
ncbi:MAG: class I SAM-dependent RNA methyltransferase [Myxococcales bacterium]|nr:class I SAM-dependent RNA methyltransferase [Myxococcales bacterium]